MRPAQRRMVDGVVESFHESLMGVCGCVCVLPSFIAVGRRRTFRRRRGNGAYRPSTGVSETDRLIDWRHAA